MNLRRILLSFPTVIISLFVTFTGCKKDDPIVDPGPVQPNVIMPLKVGNEWNFTESYYDSTENLISNKEEQQKIIRDTVIQNETWSVMNFGVNKNYFLNRQDGLYYSDVYNFSPYLAYKYPVSKGETYSYYADTFTITSTDTSITVPAGKFSCICYYAEEKIDGILSFYGYIFMSPKIGLVKSEGYNKKKSGKFYKCNESFLKSYKLL